MEKDFLFLCLSLLHHKSLTVDVGHTHNHGGLCAVPVLCCMFPACSLHAPPSCSTPQPARLSISSILHYYCGLLNCQQPHLTSVWDHVMKLKKLPTGRPTSGIGPQKAPLQVNKGPWHRCNLILFISCREVNLVSRSEDQLTTPCFFGLWGI